MASVTSTPWQRLEVWADENPEVNTVIIESGRTARWCVRLLRVRENTYSMTIADVEANTLEGAVEAALLVAAEWKGPPG